MMDAETLVLPRLGSAETRVEDPWGEDSGADPARPAPPAGRWGPTPWLLPALLMGVLGVLGAGGPGLRAEELATWERAASPWRDTWPGLRADDVTVGPYHLLVRGWAALFGTSDLALRGLSVLAMTVAAALVAALAVRMFTPRTGLLAGLLFALLPTSTRYAQEAQPYAVTLLLAVLATSLLVPAVERPRARRFAAYGAAMLVLGLCHVVVAVLLLAAHGWLVVAFRRRLASRWLIAASVAALPAAALLRLAAQHGTPIAEGSRPTLTALAATPRELFGAAALGAVLLTLALFSLPLRRSTALYTTWAVVPPFVLLLVAQATPIWQPQWLLCTLPAWATLGAVALSRTRVPWSAAALAAIALIGVPAQVAVRAPDGHQQATRQLTDIIERRQQPGDGVVYAPTDGGDAWTGRTAVAHYLPAGDRPTDVLADGSPHGDGRRAAAGCTDVARCLVGVRRLWVIRTGTQPDPVHALGDGAERLLRTRYRVAQVWRPAGFTLALLVDERTEL
ncbi:glycosyltransferase family 39 protein [Micromonospora sp. R77]|uniref:glycosyltransferase family 39 protein n=1 Tax=Micromonospora sp. R77 TaxID=2925836 RepID=UPI001F60C46C|nr:glycosyltransferase family 39 protein [Micromonospora sp. R77]MCI4066909.1 glycosyltransferase family 39 protein [Micromonospora sp. R77]